MSIYLRVIASRRCRDIGWPVIVPWIAFGLTFGCSLISGLAIGFHPASATGIMGVMMGICLLLGSADFVFLIVIGFIASVDAHAAIPASMPSNHGDVPRSARAHANRSPAEPSTQSRPATGFGRRLV